MQQRFRHETPRSAVGAVASGEPPKADVLIASCADCPLLQQDSGRDELGVSEPQQGVTQPQLLERYFDVLARGVVKRPVTSRRGTGSESRCGGSESVDSTDGGGKWRTAGLATA